MINRAYKYRIYPDCKQKIMFAKTFGCCRFIYNKMLEDKIACYDKNKTSLKTTPAQYKDTYPFLKEVDSLALANAQLHLQTAYKNFFAGKGKTGKPKFKSKHKSKAKYTTNNQHGSVRIENNKYIKLPKIGLVKIKVHRPLPNDGMI